MRVTKNNSKCRKNREPKPFKSGLKVNTVKGETVNPYTGLPAYTFYEDDSIVDKHICKVVYRKKILVTFK